MCIPPGNLTYQLPFISFFWTQLLLQGLIPPFLQNPELHQFIQISRYLQILGQSLLRLLWDRNLRIPCPSSKERSPYFKLLLAAGIGYSAEIQRVSIKFWFLDGPPVFRLHLLTLSFSPKPCSSCAPIFSLCCYCPGLMGRSGSF